MVNLKSITYNRNFTGKIGVSYYDFALLGQFLCQSRLVYRPRFLTWNPPISLQSSGTTNDSQIFDLTDVRAHYVRIISLGNSQNTFAAITKTDIYGI